MCTIKKSNGLEFIMNSNNVPENKELSESEFKDYT